MRCSSWTAFGVSSGSRRPGSQDGEHRPYGARASCGVPDGLTVRAVTAGASQAGILERLHGRGASGLVWLRATAASGGERGNIDLEGAD